jgi:hypothetical protein
MLGGPPDATIESHTAAMTRLIMAQAIRVIAGAIEELDARG